MSESEAKQERKRALETEAEEPHAGEGETSRQHGEEKKIQKAESLDARFPRLVDNDNTIVFDIRR